MSTIWRRTAPFWLVGLDAAAIAALRPRAALIAGITHPRHWVASAGTDAATAQVAGGLLWAVAGWLGVGLLACGCGALPGATGRAAGALARLVLPRALYRLAAGVAGLGVVLTPVCASAAAAPVDPPGAATAPQWPTEGRDTPHAPGWPTTPHAAPTDHPRTAPGRPVPSVHPRRPAPARIVVQRGDSLWRIAARHLPGDAGSRRVAAAWPRWYSANRRVIGRDPNLIHPGEVLRPPTEGHRS